MSRPPSQKGTSVLPVVMALKDHPERDRLVPVRLWKYFDEPMLISGWYPEEDYWLLVEALVKTLDPARVGDPWRYFATFSVQRDIGGQDLKASTDDSGGARGVYRTFAAGDATSPANFFKRATRLWSQYHDTGKLTIIGGRVANNSVVTRLTEFHIPIEGFVSLQGYFLEEYGRLVGLHIISKVTRSTVHGDPYCEWEHELGRTPATEAYVASLPIVPEEEES